MKKYFEVLSCLNIPNGITIWSALNGFLAFILICQGHTKAGLILYGISFLCDMLDGKVARKLHQTSEEGIQLDSLSDFWCFGIFPVLVSFQLFGFQVWSLIGGAVYIAGAALRLAYFNVNGMENDKFFTGIPTTFVATYFYLLIVLLTRFSAAPALLICSIYAAAAGLFMVSSVKLNKYGLISKSLFAAVPITMLLCAVLL